MNAYHASVYCDGKHRDIILTCHYAFCVVMNQEEEEDEEEDDEASSYCPVCCFLLFLFLSVMSQCVGERFERFPSFLSCLSK